MTKIYVGNLPFTATESTLEELFATYGSVVSAKIITDRDTGRSKGFAFVEMSTSDESSKAIAELNGKDNGGRPLTVTEAKPQAPRSGGGGGGGNRGGSRGGGFGRSRY